MIIKILGTGCATCKLLQKTVEDAAKELKLDCEIIKVDTMPEIMQYDIMALPGLVIDDYLVLSGGVPKLEAMLDILANREIPHCSGWSCGNKGDDCCGGGCCGGSCH